MSISLRNISKRYGKFQALADIELEIETGELVALLGPSGSGKTTLLRTIAGLETPDTGSILFHGEDAQYQSIQNRQVGFVFQHYALFRHMTVFENIAFGLEVRPRKWRPSKEAIKKKVHELLQLVQLDYLGERYPNELSGGQRQRVALARALAIEPRVLLLDEPFGALDAQVRKELRKWLRNLHNELHMTSVFVTHDVEEALEVCDRIVILNHGQIQQVGAPEEVYHNPKNAFVYQFIGEVNLFHGRGEDQQSVAYARPHEMEIFQEPQVGAVSAVIQSIRLSGLVAWLGLRTDDKQNLTAEIPIRTYREFNLKRGDKLFVRPNAGALVFDYQI